MFVSQQYHSEWRIGKGRGRSLHFTEKDFISELFEQIGDLCQFGYSGSIQKFRKQNSSRHIRTDCFMQIRLKSTWLRQTREEAKRSKQLGQT
jgi:hypothetical protein